MCRCDLVHEESPVQHGQQVAFTAFGDLEFWTHQVMPGQVTAFDVAAAALLATSRQAGPTRDGGSGGARYRWRRRRELFYQVWRQLRTVRDERRADVTFRDLVRTAVQMSRLQVVLWAANRSRSASE